MKICSKCKVEKPLSEFYNRKPGILRNACKACDYKRTSVWRRKNKNKTQLVERRWREKNSSQVLRTCRKWRKKNRHRINAIKRDWWARGASVTYRIGKNIRKRIWAALRGIAKTAATQTLLGCSVSFLKRHIENQFQPGMTWENYSYLGWHIDHIKPCAKFDLTDPAQQRECFHYTNLQPLWATDNFTKNSKYGGD